MTTIAVFNQKGGVAKTTTALNLLAAVARHGQRPLAVDLDPQCHLTHIFGVQARLADDTMYSFFLRQRPLDEIAQITRSGVVLCPAHLELAKLDSLLGKGVNIVTRLRMALHQPQSLPDAVIIDCCPLLNVLSLNAIFAADLVLVPVSADFLSLKGAEQVERALNALEPVFKRRLPRRYVLTRYDARRRMSAAVVDQMAAMLRAEEICVTRIRESVKLAESPAVGLDIFRHSPDSRGAHDYAALFEELVSAGFLERRRAGTDQSDHGFDVEDVQPPRHRLLAAVDDFAVVVHLPQPALGVVHRRGHDEDVLHALALLGPDVESVSDHETPHFRMARGPVIRGTEFQAPQGVRTGHCHNGPSQACK
jgi:chromosome partitioning protein